LARTSSIDAQKWVYELKLKNIIQFEYKELPKEFKDMGILHRAKQEGFIISLGRNGNGINVWRINDNIKCKKEDLTNNGHNLINKGDNKEDVTRNIKRKEIRNSGK
jgi:hypothetical protein